MKNRSIVFILTLTIFGCSSQVKTLRKSHKTKVSNALIKYAAIFEKADWEVENSTKIEGKEKMGFLSATMDNQQNAGFWTECPSSYEATVFCYSQKEGQSRCGLRFFECCYHNKKARCERVDESFVDLWGGLLKKLEFGPKSKRSRQRMSKMKDIEKAKKPITKDEPQKSNVQNFDSKVGGLE